ncbi:hypothetical protein GQ53DRAFT_749907 [Thozetella sp. PMI_491]|nr:hypothetical protein GQ53DRAFT_749907 [Thozetella sp. PMI_491]
MDIFDPSTPAGGTHLLNSPVVSLGRFTIDSDKRNAFQQDLSERIQILEDFSKPHVVRGGWREDKESEAQDEYSMLVGWDSVDRHKEFAQSAGFPKYAEIRQYTSSADINHYKRIV